MARGDQLVVGGSHRENICHTATTCIVPFENALAREGEESGSLQAGETIAFAETDLPTRALCGTA